MKPDRSPSHSTLPTRMSTEHHRGENYAVVMPTRTSSEANTPELNNRTLQPSVDRMTDMRIPNQPFKSWRFFTLTACFAGLQFTWSVEMAYGTPYLLSLGVPKALMSLVWLAGPLSGLIMQPLVGAWSDQCYLKWGRRRPFLVVATLLVSACFVLLAWAKSFALVVATTERVASVTIWLAVVAIYLLDFSVNVIQACGRALIVDVLTPSQQEQGTAWASRMTGIGNVLGYLMGYTDLVAWFPWFGDTQLKVLSVLAIGFLAMTVALTCYFAHEVPLKTLSRHTLSESGASPWRALSTVVTSMRNLPGPIRKVCHIQFFSWIGWFPFLIYSTTYVASLYSQANLTTPTWTSLDKATLPSLTKRFGSNAGEDTMGEATRMGSYAMLIYALVSLGVSWLLPILITPSSNVLPSSSGTGLNRPLAYSGSIVRRIISLLQCTLAQLWVISNALFGLAMLSTFVITGHGQATVMVALCGFCWSVTMWAPFSLIGEYLSQHQRGVEWTAPGGYQSLPEDVTELAEVTTKSSPPSTGTHLGHSGGPDSSDDLYRTWSTGHQPTATTSRWRGGESSQVGEHRVSPPSIQHSVSDGQVNTQAEEHPGIVSSKPVGDSLGSTTGASVPHASRPSHRTAPLSPLSSPSTLSDAGLTVVEAHSTLPDSLTDSNPQLSAGIVLGIHNMFVVLPQFLISFVGSLVFALFDATHAETDTMASAEEVSHRNNATSIAWILRIGGISSFVAMWLAWKLVHSK
ncbi:hypothetical protein IWQ62_001879 [Dispira parvispora]|uniref:MFS general substrate transporter n=1 Tax=Dispira parvispora TaxID=1520584 RepID=A0A9W8ARG2_9FUNG|nr:hypothetical protein IWQ62_001879 [Dispira parvispora]